MTKTFVDLIWDYLVFIVFIVVTSIIPLWSRIKGVKEKSKADYVFATGEISMFAMMLSIARGTLGVRAFIGFPSELFYRGSAMWETLYGYVNAYPLVTFIFIPVYFSLGITSVYQYLDLRFKSRLVRCLASMTFIARQLLSLGVTVFTPSVALNTVIGIPYWMSLVGMTFISIIFTLLGGLKAAIMADVIQGVTMIIVSIGIIIQGIYESGGVTNVYRANVDNGRMEFFNFTGDATVRVDTTSAWLGQLFMSLSLFGCQQNFVQRYVSMDSIKDVRRTLMANIPVITVLFSLSWIAGMTVYSTYVTCDPLAAGYIKKMDEILPFFVEDKFAYFPGLLGLFMATLFNGALSLNVSNLNSLATVTWEDFLAHLPHFKGYNDKQQLNIIKFIGCIAAVLVMGVAFSVGLLSGVIEGAMLMTSATSGPLLGVFLLAMLCPMANWKGAASGMIVSHIAVIWLTFGSFTIDKSEMDMLPTSTEMCSNYTFSDGITKPESSWLLSNLPLEVGWSLSNTSILQSTAMPVEEKSLLQQLYSISYMYYSLIGTFITVFLGILISYITASRDDAYDSKLLHPLFLRMSNWWPGKPRYYTNEVEIKHEITTKNEKEIHDNLAYEEKSETLNSLQYKRPSILKKNLIIDIDAISIELPDSTNSTIISQLSNNNNYDSTDNASLNSLNRQTILKELNGIINPMESNEKYRRIHEDELNRS